MNQPQFSMYLKIVYVTALSQYRHVMVRIAVQPEAPPTRLLVAVFVDNALEKKGCYC